MSVRIVNVDPQGDTALSLLREAASDVRPLYSDDANAPAPANLSLGAREVYVAALLNELPVACGSIREIDRSIGEVRRMYVDRDQRRKGLGRTVLLHLISEAKRLGYDRLRLETGDKQLPAIAFYERFGFRRIPPFGEYVKDPTSVCYELYLNEVKTSVSAA
jgi:putative acetyltransferase